MRLKKRTKIVCTIGPASNKPEKLEGMVRAGMNVARLNSSHGSHEDHTRLITNIRGLSSDTGEPIAILQDLQGPKVRVGKLPEEGVKLDAGKKIILSTEPDAKLPKIPVGYGGLHGDVGPGDRLLLDDGLMDVKVTKVKGPTIGIHDRRMAIP